MLQHAPGRTTCAPYGSQHAHVPPSLMPPVLLLPQHLVVPAHKMPQHYSMSPLLGAQPRKRDILLFFRGDFRLGVQDNKYSRGIRQAIYKMYKKHRWTDKYKVVLSYRNEHSGAYGGYVGRSKFCLARAGADAGARCWCQQYCLSLHAPTPLLQSQMLHSSCQHDQSVHSSSPSPHAPHPHPCRRRLVPPRGGLHPPRLHPRHHHGQRARSV
jgi:hypothetical protein